MSVQLRARVASGKGEFLQGWAHSYSGLRQGCWLSDHTGWTLPLLPAPDERGTLQPQTQGASGVCSILVG